MVIDLGEHINSKDSFPNEWDLVPLSEICELRRETVEPQYYPHKKYIGLEHITPGKSTITAYGDTSSVKSSKHYFYPGDILYGKLRPYLDKCAIAQLEGVCSTDILTIKVKPNKSIPEFLVYSFHTNEFLGHAIATTSGTNHPRTSWKSIKEFKVPLPPLPEQRAIAHVLNTVRQAIEATERVIAAARELKRSMMKHLFTYGPVPVHEADQVPLKETEIGEVPEGWEISYIEDICDVNKFNRDPTIEQPEDEFVYIDISSIDNETGKITLPTRILGRSAPSRARRVIHTNDVILSTVRPYLKAFAIVPQEYDNQICSTGFAVLSQKSLASAEYLYYISLSDIIGKQFQSRMKGASYPAINQGDVNETKIPVPKLHEQIDIGDYLSTLDKKIISEIHRKSALESLFKSLLHHLMTGKVRVNTLIPGPSPSQGEESQSLSPWGRG